MGRILAYLALVTTLSRHCSRRWSRMPMPPTSMRRAAWRHHYRRGWGRRTLSDQPWHRLRSLGRYGVTNAHVVRDAVRDSGLQIGIVPNGGGEATYGRLIAASPKNDLALIRITGGNLRLPPLALAGGAPPDSGEVTSVGYPMNVDRAQGLEIGDIFRSQPPVKSRGFISGQRPSRQFDTILHTAPIARGNSGGPLLDTCGRVLGVNSFGADNEGGDAEFFFAVSMRELLPFLRANDVTPRVNERPCRSMADLDAAERERIEREQQAARQDLAQRAEASRAKRERAQLEAEQAVMTEREDRVFLAFVLLLVAFALGQWAIAIYNSEERDETRMRIVAVAAAVAVLAAIAAYLTRPGLDEIDRRVAAGMQDGSGPVLPKNRSPATSPCNARSCPNAAASPAPTHRTSASTGPRAAASMSARNTASPAAPGAGSSCPLRGCGLGQQFRPRPPHLSRRTLPPAAQRDGRSPRSARQVQAPSAARRMLQASLATCRPKCSASFRVRLTSGWSTNAATGDSPRLGRQRFPAQRDTMHLAGVALIVVQSIVPGRAIVPDRHRARLPSHAAGVVRRQCLGIKASKQRQALLACHADNVHRESAVDVEQLAARDGVADHHRMRRAGFQIVHAQFAAHVGLRIKPVGPVDMIGGVERLQPLDLLLEIVRQRIVCRTHMREQCVAAAGRQGARNEDRSHRGTWS